MSDQNSAVGTATSAQPNTPTHDLGASVTTTTPDPNKELGSYDEVRAKIDTMPDGPEKDKAKALAANLYDKSSELPVVKSAGHKISVRGFFGSYRKTIFQEDPTGQWGHATVDDETLEVLRKEYPKAEIREDD